MDAYQTYIIIFNRLHSTHPKTKRSWLFLQFLKSILLNKTRVMKIPSKMFSKLIIRIKMSLCQ